MTRDTRLTAGTTATGRRERRKQETRQQLLRAGRRLFGERGIYDSRIEDLTAVAGIAKGTIYGYFADKEALVHAVVKEGFDAMLAHVSEATHGRAGRARLDALVRAHLTFFAANPDLMRIFHQVRGALKFHRPEWRLLREALEDYLASLAALLPGGRADRAPARARVEVAQLLFGAVSGVSSVRASLDEEFARPALVAPTVGALRAMMTAATRGAPSPRGPRARLARRPRAVAPSRRHRSPR